MQTALPVFHIDEHAGVYVARAAVNVFTERAAMFDNLPEPPLENAKHHLADKFPSSSSSSRSPRDKPQPQHEKLYSSHSSPKLLASPLFSSTKKRSLNLHVRLHWIQNSWKMIIYFFFLSRKNFKRTPR